MVALIKRGRHAQPTFVGVGKTDNVVEIDAAAEMLAATKFKVNRTTYSHSYNLCIMVLLFNT